MQWELRVWFCFEIIQTHFALSCRLKVFIFKSGFNLTTFIFKGMKINDLVTNNDMHQPRDSDHNLINLFFLPHPMHKSNVCIVPTSTFLSPFLIFRLSFLGFQCLTSWKACDNRIFIECFFKTYLLYSVTISLFVLEQS